MNNRYWQIHGEGECCMRIHTHIIMQDVLSRSKKLLEHHTTSKYKFSTNVMIYKL